LQNVHAALSRIEQLGCAIKEVHITNTIVITYLCDKKIPKSIIVSLKISKLKILWKQRHLHLGCP